ncbi:hypothetical protein [Methylobacterium thuringiense]|uniref:Chemotaxis protein n=1 Tax=Methylobacterium thuringiense TaxID=1003091 RepID=A0ABQ4TMJ3_9HYPH|nr:hypothetical protein [Methylobacterium thuringiense]GJE55260.1 hypothetical protein EKPJFOCH_1749 [Methylobacterium thuringiense]
MDVPASLPSSVTEAGSKIVTEGGVLGALLILALFGIAALVIYIRSLHASRDKERDKWQSQLLDIQEKRITENRASLSSQADATAVLSKNTETSQTTARLMESIGSALRDSAADQRATSYSIKEAVNRIEVDISNLSAKIDRPLVQTPHGFARTGGVS